MSDPTIPEEAIEAAAIAMIPGWEHAPESTKPAIRQRLRLALPAAAPLILAVELDRLAATLDLLRGHSVQEKSEAGSEGNRDWAHYFDGKARAFEQASMALAARANVLRGES